MATSSLESSLISSGDKLVALEKSSQFVSKTERSSTYYRVKML